MLLAQKWAERKRRLLVIVPANLRKQWSQELADKFFLPSVILEPERSTRPSAPATSTRSSRTPIILCSYQFARSKEPYVRQTPWDLVVIDEAHRLRNVYKNTSKIALAIKQAVAPFPKVLLTATPLQNSLLELYGLVSIIDEYAFGDLKSYRTRFARLGNDADFAELKERLEADLQAHAAPAGARVRQVHQPPRAGPGVRPDRRRAAALRPRLGLPAAADALRAARPASASS